MNWINAALKELFSLFVDDVRFTISIVIWIGIGTLVVPKLSIATAWLAPVLFLGCAVVLIVSVWTAARSQ